MASRMERYYRLNTDAKKRSRRNQALYDKIYDSSNEYSNIEGIARIEKTNEIDIQKIRKMLRERESMKRKTPEISVPEAPKKEEIVKEVEPVEEKNYDIRDILVKAKEEKPKVAEDQYRSLKNTQYNILKGINIQEEMKRREQVENQEDELKELIHTITNTSMLKQLGDNDLSLDLLSDLKSVNETQVDTDSIQAILAEAKASQEDYKIEDTRDLDKSFYTSSLNFSDEDFEELGEIHKKHLKRRKIWKTVACILVLALMIVAAYFVGKYLI